MTIKTLSQSLLLSLFSALLTMGSALAQPLTVLVPPDVWSDYERLLNGRDPLLMEDYRGPGSRRDVVEVVLLQQALARAGSDYELTFQVESDYNATLDALVKGSAIASATSAWLSDLTPIWNDIFITTAVIDRGQFEAGFYTTPTNTRALNARDDDALRSLRGISSRHWEIDWETLNAFGAEQLTHAQSWGQMVDSVLAGEQDYLLAPFQQTRDLSLRLAEGTLIPIPGVKIGLAGTRHFAVSRAHPASRDFNTALHLGLMRLKKDGTLRRAYEDAGFINRDVADWRPVNTDRLLNLVTD